MTNIRKFRSNLLFNLGAEKDTTSHLSIISHELDKKFDRNEISTAATFNLWTEAAEKDIDTNELAIIHLNGREVLILYDLTRHDTGKPKLFLAMKTNNHDGKGSIVQLIPEFPEDETILRMSRKVNVDDLLDVKSGDDLVDKMKQIEKGQSIKRAFFPIPISLLASTNATGLLDRSTLFGFLFTIIEGIQAESLQRNKYIDDLIAFCAYPIYLNENRKKLNFHGFKLREVNDSQRNFQRPSPSSHLQLHA